jgi:hypothetical protein
MGRKYRRTILDFLKSSRFYFLRHRRRIKFQEFLARARTASRELGPSI